jgi:uncharacterized membrane protein YoaK (UPF0700 family)
MMQGAPSTQSHRLLWALGLLTFATGLVDAASVLGLGHVFTANMTGNVIFLGFSLAGAGPVATGDCALALGAFLVGALAGGAMAARGVRFSVALALEGAALAAAAAIAWGLGDGPSLRTPLIALLAIAMGLQNSSVRKLGVPDMTTTVLTLTLTGLAAESSLAGGDNPRWVRRVASVACMLIGGFAGALLLRHGVRWPIGAAALLVAGAFVVVFAVARTAVSTGA